MVDTTNPRPRREERVMKSFSTYESHWDEMKGKLKQRFGQLTDDDLMFVKGKGEELLGRLREKLNMSEHELHDTLTELKSSGAAGVENAKAKIGAVVDEAREKASAVASDVKARASAAAEDVKAQASAAYDDARVRARGLFSEGEEYVRHNPRECVLAALFAGFVAGILIRR